MVDGDRWMGIGGWGSGTGEWGIVNVKYDETDKYKQMV